MSTLLRLCLLFVGAWVLYEAAAYGDALSAVLALAIGALAWLRVRDADRIAALERRLEGALRGRAAERERPPALGVAPSSSDAGVGGRVALEDAPVAAEPARPVLEDGPGRDGPAPSTTGRRVPPGGARPRPRASRPPAFSWDDLPPEARRVWNFVTGGNAVARVGLVVLFVGIGLGIRYAVEQGVLPVGVRLAAAAAAGLVMVGLGWRLRRGTPGFGLTLQGGGVAVLYLTVYSAYALYGIVPSLPAIALMAAVSVLCGALAVLQNAPGLAVLGVAGGFAAPVLAGTDDGSHVLLLSYYALLNLGVLGVAWSKGWRSVAVVGFVSTFVTGGLWGGLQYRPGLYPSVQPFVVLSFAVYLALAVRFAVRSAQRSTPERALVVDGALVFGLPAATFALQAGLVEGVVPFGRAWSAAALAAVYLAGAALLRRRRGLGLLADGFLAVGLAFATLALPLAFERVLVGAMWVLEGAGLVWVGARQRKGWMRAAGIGLQAVAAAVLFGEGVVSPSDAFTAETLTGWVVAVGLALSAYVLRPEGRQSAGALDIVPPSVLEAGSDLDASRGAEAGPEPVVEAGARPAVLEGGPRRWGLGWERPAGLALLGAALFWWVLTVTAHVLDLAPDRHWLAAMVGATALSAALFVVSGRAAQWRALRVAAFGAVPAAWTLWLAALVTDTTLATGWRGPAWLALFAAAGWALASGRGLRFRRAAYVGAVWLGAAVVATAVGQSASDVVRRGLEAAPAVDSAWATGAVLAVWVAALVLAWRAPESWASRSERATSTLGLTVAAVAWTSASWRLSGTAAPLPTVPVVNPLGLPTVALLLALVAVRRGLGDGAQRPLAVVIGGLGFGALTVEVLRGVSAFGGVAYDLDALYASSTAQAALAVVWTVLALVLAVVAVRRGSRGLWFFGAGILGLVVAKLFVVDLSQAEALVRIGAFLVVGTLVLLIGYRAPLPPDHEPAPDPP